MKKLSLIAFLGLSSIAFSQNTNTVRQEVKSVSEEKSLLVKTDHAELDAKKKAAEEKAKLPKPYDPKADAEKDIQNLIAKAKKEKKNIMIQAGGNWCIWCLRFNQYVQTTPELKKLVDDNYLYYHLNYSPENKNEKIFAKYGDPGTKFGYPVFIVLDQNGKMIHVQQSEVLEEGKGYSLEKVKEFFNVWSPKS
ncbi:thioredoxin family protein [Chryseobacterium mucoviscidosis]|uniref:Thioredoxin family protein n=1 Tax=Chryseobacterium mucoviscidosis TaxID=1945581 RepID=A0A202BYS5_9FLAO|nr:thioredoxin family protein [Chryseobacterium mucoviscidosis]OVE56659.1 thioredoxin family protein [Chryseobacterium mucoviscidosis]